MGTLSLVQLPAHVPLLVHVDGGGLRHQRGLLRHRQEEVLGHQLLVRVRQVARGPSIALYSLLL